MDYQDALGDSEMEHLPTRFRRFLFRETPPSSGTQSLGFFSYGYTRAVEELADYALKRWPLGDYMRMPLFFLARHSLELHLKYTIETFSFQPDDQPTYKGHSLLQLWNQFIQLASRVGLERGDAYVELCTKRVKHMHDADPTGEAFRYPMDTSGVVLPYTRVELIELIRAHWHIIMICDGSIEILRQQAT